MEQKNNGRQHKVDCVLRIRKPRSEFHRWWMVMTRPFHHMSDAECKLAAAILDRRAELLSRGVPEDVVDPLSTKERVAIRESLGLSVSSFNVSLFKLRKAGFIKDDKVSASFIPKPDDKGFGMLISFEFNEQS